MTIFLSVNIQKGCVIVCSAPFDHYKVQCHTNDQRNITHRCIEQIIFCKHAKVCMSHCSLLVRNTKSFEYIITIRLRIWLLVCSFFSLCPPFIQHLTQKFAISAKQIILYNVDDSCLNVFAYHQIPKRWCLSYLIL